LTSLMNLSLDKQYDRGYQPLGRFDQPGVLSLDHNTITDIGPLAGLTNLRWLDLGRNR